VTPGGDLPYGVIVIDDYGTFTLSQLTSTVAGGEHGSQRGPETVTPLTIYLVIRLVLLPGYWRLDRWTEGGIIRERGIAGYFPLLPPQLPNLSTGMWIHLLTDRMLEYNVKDIKCEPRDAPADCGTSLPPRR
jgi:hypothetical protein